MKIRREILCNVVRSRYPSAFGIRKSLQKLRIKRLRRFMLSAEEVCRCEKHPELIPTIIATYLVKYKKRLRYIEEEMEGVLKHSPNYQPIKDKDALRTDMLYWYLAHGFLPSEYACFDFEGKTREERLSFVSDIDTKEFGYTVNDIAVMQGIIEKGRCYQNYPYLFHRDALVIENKSDFEAFKRFIGKHPVFVEKEVLSCMGKGVKLVDINKLGTSTEAYFNKLIATGRHLLEERMIQCAEMSRFNPSSVNTVRCITMRTDEGIEVPWCFMRTGKGGSFVDNGGSGGLFLGVDVKTGVITSPGIDEHNKSYAVHPDTGVRFEGEQIPRWNEMIQFCKTESAKIKGMNYLSWDMALTDSGWDVIEVNEIGQLIGPQMTMKRGIRKELENLLQRMPKVV